MKTISRAALAFAIATLPLAGMTAAPASAQALSPAVGKPLQQASNSARAGNVAAASGFVDQARAAAKTPAERTKVAQMAAYVYTRGGNFARAASELERIGAPASQLAPLYYQARQYDKAIEQAKKSGQTTIIAQSYLMQGKAGEAAKMYNQMLARQPNNPTLLQNLAGAQFKMGDRKAYMETIQRLIRVDPTPARWRTLLVDMKGQNMSRDSKLALYHLMRETGSLSNPTDVQDFAKIAIVSGQPGIAADVVRKSTESGVLTTDDMTNRLLQAADKRQAAAIATAPADARAANTALNAGHAYLGAGMYPQAVAAYTLAQKGPNPSEAALFKGVAEVRGGNAAAARTTFGAIPAGPMTELGGLWQLYAATRG
jgi:tetratricopeptide (TPR) repeat protein